MIKNALLVLAFLFALVPTAQAFNPPPGGSHFFFKPPPLPPQPDPCTPPDPRCTRLLNPYIKIELPPKLIFTPVQLLFPESGATYNFINDKFAPNSQQYLRHRVETKLEGSGDGAYYVITIFGFVRDELPNVKDFRMTFREPVSKSSIEKVEEYLKNPFNYVPTAQLTGANCVADLQNPKSHICLDTITKVHGQTTSLQPAHVRQTISVRGTFVPGNVAAPGEISGFSLGNQSLAVGGTILVIGGTKLGGYLKSQPAISWSRIESKLDKIFINRDSAQKSESISSPYLDNNWQLNSSDRNNPNVSATSFSSPPEGNLWNVTVNSTSFAFGDLDRAINFSGSGTIVFSSTGQNGDVNLTFNGPITCSPNTRLAFITRGNIVFRPSSTGEVKVGCGSYTSLGGNINFAPTPHTVKAGQLKGIFVARNSIVLPVAEELTSTFSIDRDNVFAENPTVLLRELLKLVFSPS